APRRNAAPARLEGINLFDKSSRAPPRGRVPLARRRKIREVRRRAPCWQATSDDSVRAVAQLGRAPGSGPGGRGFKSHQPDNLCCEAAERLGSCHISSNERGCFHDDRDYGIQVFFFTRPSHAHWLPFVLTARAQRWNHAKALAI